MSDSVWPHRRQPTRLPHTWDSPGKNTGVGCHFLFQCMKVKSESEVTQSCLTLSDLVDCSLPAFSAHGIFQARVLEWGAIAFSDLCKLDSSVGLYSLYVHRYSRLLSKNVIASALYSISQREALARGWGMEGEPEVPLSVPQIASLTRAACPP